MSGEPTYLQPRYVGNDPDAWKDDPFAILGDMADHWMSNGAEGHWPPEQSFAHFTVTTRPEGSTPETAESFHITAYFHTRLFGWSQYGVLRPASMYVPR